MTVQFIETPGGRMAVLPEEDYRLLLDAAQDASDLAAVQAFEQRLSAGEEELLPEAMVRRLVQGENAVRVWRGHRGLSPEAFSQAAGLDEGTVRAAEAGTADVTVETMRRLAQALGVDVEDLV